MKRTLVTGAGGFVGCHLVPYLHEKGFEVWSSFHRGLKRFPFPVHGVRADLTDYRETLNLIARSRPDYLFHLAGQTVPSQSWIDPGQTLRSNVVASIFLLEAVLRFSPRARVVFFSSGQVYGTTFWSQKKVSEKDLPNPLGPYAGSKLLMEMAALNFFKEHGVSVVIARAFNQTGPGQKETYVLSNFCRQIALMERKKRPPVLKVGNIHLARDFVHVRDSIRAYDLLARRGRAGEIYNVGSGKEIKLSDVLDFLAGESRVRFSIKVLSSRLRGNDPPHALLDISKIKALGWRPQASIWDALRELLEEWRQKVR